MIKNILGWFKERRNQKLRIERARLTAEIGCGYTINGRWIYDGAIAKRAVRIAVIDEILKDRTKAPVLKMVKEKVS